MKKAFTLIELVIAVIVFALAITLLYGVINGINKKEKRSIKEYREYHKVLMSKKLFYEDLMYAKKIFKDNDKKIYIFQTKNSLYALSNPYVVYKLKDKTLYRIESYKKLTRDMTSQDLENARVLPVLKDCIDFLIFEKGDYITVFYKIKNRVIFKVRKLSSLM